MKKAMKGHKCRSLKKSRIESKAEELSAVNVKKKHHIEGYKKIKELYKKIYLKETIFYNIFSLFLLFTPILITLDNHLKIAGFLLTSIPLFLGGIIILLYQKKKIIKILLILFLLLVNISYATNYSQQFNFIKPLLIFIIMFDIFENEKMLNCIKNNLEKHKKMLNIFIWFIALLNLFMYISNKGISIEYSKAWGLKAFQGIFYDPNQAAYKISTLIVYSILLIKMKINNKYLSVLLLMIFEFLLLMTGARVPTGLGIALGMIGLWNIKDDFLIEFKAHKKIFCVFGIIIAILLVCFLPRTAFFEKIINEINGSTGFDNGRGIMWKNAINYYSSQDIMNKIFGNDIQTVYQLNKESLGAMIWCHNDIIQILLQFGLGIVIIYIYTFIRAMLLHLKNESKFDKLIIILLYMVFVFVAIFNGLFYHPRFVISIPILFITYKNYNNYSNINKE